MIDLPQGKKILVTSGFLHLKYKADGTVEHYKACLVVKGFAQTYGVE